MTITAAERANVDMMFSAMDGILIDHSEASVDQHFHPDFVQHNPWAADGAAHVKEMCQFEFPLVSKRWVAQGDLVGYHGYYGTPNPLGETPLVCFDLWRIDGDKIVEHWDGLMPVPDEATAEALTGGGGDGGAAVGDDEVSANAATARRFLEAGVRPGDAAVIAEALAEDVTHHTADGPVTGPDRIVELVGGGKALSINQTVASGDLVVAHVHLTDDELVVWDVLRFDRGRIAEMWSLRQPIAPAEEQANTHPHF